MNFQFIYLFSRTYVCLSARQENQAPRFATQGIQSLNDWVMHSSVLRRWMMHTAWTALKEITVRGDGGKVVVKSPNFSNHMQPSWPHIKTNLPFVCLLYSVSLSAFLLRSRKKNTLLKETGNETVHFCSLLKCAAVFHFAFPHCLAIWTDLDAQVNS